MPIFSFNILGLHIAPTWYGLAYALGFLIGYQILRSRKVFSETDLDNLLLFVFCGVILGGRLGYVLFYDFGYYLAHPVDILKTWNGGMSFHGGTIGVIVVMGLYAGKYRQSFLNIADQVTSILPIGLGLGRIGNYINGELLGFAPYSWPLAVIKNGQSYFPSPLLEASLEGLVLFFILSFIFRHRKYPGQVALHFLLWYGIFRFFIEFFRLPDPQIGYLIGNTITMGQILTIPMIVGGIAGMYLLRTKN